MFIGFGTGRCGTKSLAKIIDACMPTTHESPDWRITWYNPDYSKIDTFLASETNDVGFYWLPHLEYILTKKPNIKLVWVWQDKQSTVESFIHGQRNIGGEQVIYGPTRPMPNGQKAPRAWNQMYPFIDAHNLETSIGLYWDMYDAWASTIDCYKIDVQDLNNQQKVDALFDYLEIPKQDRVFLENNHFNKRK